MHRRVGIFKTGGIFQLLMHLYVMFICGFSTEACLFLKSQVAKVVTEAMVEVFSRVGVPNEILSVRQIKVPILCHPFGRSYVGY